MPLLDRESAFGDGRDDAEARDHEPVRAVDDPAPRRRHAFVSDSEGESYPVAEPVFGAGTGPVRIPPGTGAPWAWICRVASTYPDGNRAVFTGWLASPALVVTSARCVHHPAFGSPAKIEVLPGGGAAAGFARPLEATAFRYVSGWLERQDPACDYAAVLLPGPVAAGVGHFGLALLSAAEVDGEVVNMAGFREDLDREALAFEAFRVRGASDAFLFREGGLHDAAPGSPIWLRVVREGRPQRLVCGMGLSDGEVGGALRLTRPVFDNLRRWVEEAASQSGPPAAGTPAPPVADPLT